MPDTLGTSISEARPSSAVTDELVFRIRGGDYNGRIVRIRSAKCTIGSTPDCTLRLTGPGVRPLHCIIMKSDAGAMARRWSPDTQLNGRAFSDALLMVGDRLQIGPIELEVLDDTLVAAASAKPAVTMDSAPRADAVDLAGKIVQHLRQDLARGKDSRKLKLQRKRLRAARQKVKSLKAGLQRSAAETKRLEAELQHLRTISGAERQRAAAENQQLQATVADLQQAAAAQQASLDQAKADFSQQLEKFERERQELLDASSSQRSGIEQEGSTHISEERQVWQEERARLLKSLEEKAHLEHRLEVALSELRKAVDQEHLQSAEERQQVEEERRQLEERSQQLNQLQAWCDEVQLKSQEFARQTEAAQAEVETLKFKIAELEQTSNAGNEGGDAQVHHEGELTAELRRQLHAAAAESERLREQLTARQQEASEALEMKAQWEAKRRDAEQRLVACETERDQLRAELVELKAAPRSHEAIAEPGDDSQLQLELIQKCEEAAQLQNDLSEAKHELQRREEDYQIQVQNFQRRIESLEKLARTLEDELRGTNADMGNLDQLQQEKSELESQLAASQQQWAQDRKALEEEALSAHQQLQELEDQVASLRDALRATKEQVRERDNLLTQLRDEVRQQMQIWQAEREELLQTQAKGNHVEQVSDLPEDSGERYASGTSEGRTDEGFPPSVTMPFGNGDWSHLAETEQEKQTGDEHEPAVAQSEETNELEVESREAPVSVDDVLARLGARLAMEDSEDARANVGDEYVPSNDGTASSYAEPVEEDSSASEDSSSYVSYTNAEFQPEENTAEPVNYGSSLTTPVFGNAEGLGAPASSNSGAADDDESIEAYMARLLKRVRGDAVASAFSLQPTAPTQYAEPVVESPEVEQSTVEEMPTGEFLPRKSAPELATDMAAMRELAVHSARHAITESSRRRHRQAALLTTFGAWSSLVGATILFGWAWDTNNYLAWGGFGLCSMGGVYLIIRRLRLKPAAKAKS